MYPDGIPEPDRIGFIQLNAFGHGGDFEAAIARVCQKLQREPHFVDVDGYENEVTAASVDEAHSRMAWVECHSKESKTSYYVDVRFDLKVQLEERLVVDWEIETYNPYFGCQIALFHWTSEHLVVIYHEKHDTFACSFAMASKGNSVPLFIVLSRATKSPTSGWCERVRSFTAAKMLMWLRGDDCRT